MPGPVDTGKLSTHHRDVERMLTYCVEDALKGVPKEALDYYASLATAEKRIGRPDDIAQICGFLAEEGSRWINGDTISATGGMDIL